MINADKDALVCDLAETYQVFDMRSLPLTTVATLSAGLRETSRIKMKISGQKYPIDTLLQAAAIDRLSLLIWMQTKDGRHGVRQPQSILEALTENKERNFETFATPEDFKAAWRALTHGD